MGQQSGGSEEGKTWLVRKLRRNLVMANADNADRRLLLDILGIFGWT